jgi:hypothetical protein
MNHHDLTTKLTFAASRLALGLSALLAFGCAAGVEDDMELAGDEAIDEVEEALGTPPASCQEIKSANPGAGNGAYRLFIDHDPAKPWWAHCHNMATSPAEYLSLQNVGPNVNFSQYTAGGAVSGTDVRTRYGKIRIDPATLLVDISDQTFTTSSGQLTHGGEAVTSMPFGVGMSCDATDSGVANIDLRGTPFAVKTGEFLQGGAGSSGSATYSSDNRVVDITGGGYCGWTCASPATFNPFNDAGDFQLDLVYAP